MTELVTTTTTPTRPPACEPAVVARSKDPQALIGALESSDRFRKDSRLGGIFHRGKTSFRELSPTDSLHITIDGGRVSAHVDRICPLSFRPARSSQYSIPRIVAHNLSVLVADLVRLVRQPGPHHRCQLECEAVWVDEDAITDALPPSALLAPRE